MKRYMKTRSRKKMKKRTPSGKQVVHIKKERPAYMKCGKCGKKIVRARLIPKIIKKISKVKKRPERPLPHLCSKCLRVEMKTRLR